jgi:integrase
MSTQAPTQANACMVYLRALCNHARDMYATEDGEYQIFAVNPVTQMLKLRKLNPTKPRKGRVPKERIGAVWLFLRSQSVEARRDTQRTAADWLSSVLLTGTRLTESGALKRADVDLVEKTIRLREDVVKNHNELLLPLSTVLYEILSKRLQPQDGSAAARRRRRQRSSEYVFPSFGKKRPHIADARAMMKGVSNVAGRHVTVQDLRRTAEDIAKYCKVDPD